MPKKVKDIGQGLHRKGFQPKSGDHNYYLYYTTQGKKTAIFTKLSHGKREYDDTLLGKMAKQLRIDRKFLNELIDCPKSRDDYEKHLRETKNIR